MKALQQYIDHKNVWRSLTKQPLYDINNLTANDVTVLCQSLDGDLSPENLTCDGEISASQAQAKYRFYVRVARDLEKTGHPVTLYEI